MRTLSSLIGVAALVPLFWFSVVPNGTAYCTVPATKTFAPQFVGDQASINAAGAAQHQFCVTVASMPKA